jgi:Cu(I)/Ag(I) efflux system membrane protein CusA/SilA
MVRKLIELALRNRFIVLLLAGGLFVWGLYSIRQNPMMLFGFIGKRVIVFTEWMGQVHR